MKTETMYMVNKKRGRINVNSRKNVIEKDAEVKLKPGGVQFR